MKSRTGLLLTFVLLIGALASFVIMTDLQETGSVDSIPASDETNGEREVGLPDPKTLDNGGGESAVSHSSEDVIFRERTSEIGFNYTRQEPIFLDGASTSGVYISDVDNDGLSDIMALSDDSHPIIFRNNGGEYSPTSINEVDIDISSALFFDHDNDGWDDLLLLPKYDDEEGVSVFLENERGEFVERAVGLEVEMGAARGASAADYTGNGCLDVFVAQAQSWEDERPSGYRDSDITIDEDNGEENRLFAGDCGSFEEVTEEAGIEGSAWSLATSFVDFTNDGYPDIHVANDFNNDVLYLNNGDGTFERRVMPEFTNRNGMSSEVADVTGNGYLDIFVTNIYSSRNEESGEAGKYRYSGRTRGNNLLLNQGNGSFVDAAEEYGVRQGGWGWAAVFADFSNDRNLDLYHASGTSFGKDYHTFWTGNSSGFENRDVSTVGNILDKTTVGVSTLDYDMDGRMDMAVSPVGGSYAIYENTDADGNYLKIDVEGDGNHTTIGTRVYVEAGGEEQMQVKTSRTDYMSQSSRVLHFGLGDADTVDELRVVFPDGNIRTMGETKVNQRITVKHE